MRRRRDQAATGRFLLVTAAVLLVGFLLVVGLAEGLRHPHPGGPVIDEPLADPRVPVVCPEVELGEEVEDVDDVDVGLRAPSPPAVVSSSELLDCPESFNRRLVRYRGEVVGGLFRRPYGTWTQLNDDAYADLLGPLPAHRNYRGGNSGVGVLLPDDAVGEITTVGGPRDHGDIVEVVGTFRRADPESQEVAVIRAASARVVRPGRPFEDVALPDRQVAAALLGLLAVTLVVTERLVARRRRR